MNSTGTIKRTCAAVKSDGSLCRSWAVAGSAFCQAHEPARAAGMAEARRKGGHARHGRRIGTTGDSEPIRLQTLADVLALLERTANDLLAMENSVSRARALVALAAAWADCFETSEIERRLTALEAAQHGNP